MFRIESFLSARLFVVPQIIGTRIFFLSNLSGHLSLYAMEYGGSVPEPLLPPYIALQNPHLIGGYSFYVFPKVGKILVMIDQDGDENYQPMLIPMEGGFPEPLSPVFNGTRVHFVASNREQNLAYLLAESRQDALQTTYRANLATGEITELGASIYGLNPAPNYEDSSRAVLVEGYETGDTTMYLWTQGEEALDWLYGVPIEEREPGQQVPLNGIQSLAFTPDGKGILVVSSVFEDTFSLAIMQFDQPGELKPVSVRGLVHQGVGEMVEISELTGDRFTLAYNIDGSSWIYETRYHPEECFLEVLHVICGQGQLSDGVLESYQFDKAEDRFILSFSTAVSPTQIYTVEGPDRKKITSHTREKVFGIDPALLSPGEDAAFVSYDGTRISARLYLPAEKLGFVGPRPVVYYVHGGPQGQERPDFAWFSMPLIQYLTLNGFAVFVPNVRGSTGYGLSYTKQVDRDWGGRDRLDHVHAMQVLSSDPRLDTQRAGVVGRSYGGYMTLTLAGRHPELWKAAVDMFGPFDLITFLERIPPTWKPYFNIALGNPETDRDFLMERSPRTYIDSLACPMLVIQGKNDPRVVASESTDLVNHLRSIGKQVEYLMFENEGHDVLKYENRVRCYNEITEFFKKILNP